MRPFRQPYPSQRSLELDEEATAELTAELRSAGLSGVFPVQRPERERWFDVHVVLEDDPAAPLWQAPLEEFARVLAQSGAFRTVRTWSVRLGPDDPRDAGCAALMPMNRMPDLQPDGHDRRVLARIGGDPRQLVLFASHGASTHWLDGSYASLLLSWSGSVVALLHLLPPDRHAQTALGEPHGVGWAPRAGSPSSELSVETMWWRTEADPASPRVARLPMATLDPASLGTWALTEMARGRRSAIYLLDADQSGEGEGERPNQLDEDGVGRRLASLRDRSPTAYELAIALAAGPFTLPVARVVQDVLLGDATDTTMLADLLLSGLVAMDHGGIGGDATFRVVDHARAVLTGASRASDRARLAEELRERVGRHLADKTLDEASFTALVRDPQGAAALPAWARPFVRFATPLVEGLQPRPGHERAAGVLLHDLPPHRISQMHRLLVRGEALSERTVRADLWNWMRGERLLIFGGGGWRIIPELAESLREAANEDPLFGLQLLWVDDRPVNNRRVAQALRDRDVDIAEAKDTEEAVALAERDAFDVIVSDMSRPPRHEAGLELIAALRDRDAPVIIYASAFAESAENRARVREAGGFACTNRPAELLEHILEAAYAALSPALTGGGAEPGAKNPPHAPSFKIDAVRRGFLAQLAARYGLTQPHRPRRSPTLASERARLVSLISSRAGAMTLAASAGQAAGPSPQGDRPRAVAAGRQTPQSQQIPQAQGDRSRPGLAPLHFLVNGDFGLKVADAVSAQLQLAISSAEFSGSAGDRQRRARADPKSWHAAFKEHLGRATGWTISRTSETTGSVENDGSRAALPHWLAEAGCDGSAVDATLALVDEWLHSEPRARPGVSSEVPGAFLSVASYRPEDLSLRVAVLSAGRRRDEDATLVVFSSFKTSFHPRSLLRLRFTPRIEVASLATAMKIPLETVLKLEQTMRSRLAEVGPDRRPRVETRLLDGRGAMPR